MIAIKDFIKLFKEIQVNDPRINSFGAGPLYDIQDQVKYYPYLWIDTTLSHNLDSSFIEYTFRLRVGDKVNNQKLTNEDMGIFPTNTIDIISNTFIILSDVLFELRNYSNEYQLNEDITIDPFYDEDSHIVSGNEAEITLRFPLNGCERTINKINSIS